MSVSINIDKVVKKYGDTVVVNGLSVDIMPGEFFTLLGPSGCGKTTLLRMIIGFNSIEGGTISVDGNVINDVATDKRNMGMVFQNYAIFPHMSVKDNVAFGLRMRKVPEKEIEERVDKILKIVKIDHLKDRMPTALSGGQQQRVALARAIVIRPQVLLMDEPLSNLDAKLRIEMRNAIKQIQRRVDITTVYVTHDQEEALAVSDRIAVMNGGVICQIGRPADIYKRPKNVFVSTFIGLAVLFAVIVGIVNIVYVRFGFGAMPASCKTLTINVPEDLEFDGVFDEPIERYASSFELSSIQTTNMGSLFQLRYDITLRERGLEKKLIDELRCLNGNLKITLGAAATQREAL